MGPEQPLGKVLTLIVGGVKFTTLRSTFLRIPTLYERFGDGPLCFVKDEKQRFFIDRNPDVFAALLTALRGHDLDAGTLQLANAEAAFWDPEVSFGEERLECVIIQPRHQRHLSLPNSLLQLLPDLEASIHATVIRKGNLPMILGPDHRCLGAINDLARTIDGKHLLHPGNWSLLSRYLGLTEKLPLDLGKLGDWPKAFDPYQRDYAVQVVKLHEFLWVVLYDTVAVHQYRESKFDMGRFLKCISDGYLWAHELPADFPEKGGPAVLYWP